MSEKLEDLTPNQRRAHNKALAALETMATVWGAEIGLRMVSLQLALKPEAERAKAIAAFIEQAFIEGAYRHYLDRDPAAQGERAQHAGAAEKPPEFEIRVGGIHMAGASGPRERALQEAQRYFRQYAFDATEDEPVQLVEVIEIAAAPVAAMSATPPAGER